MNNVNTQGQFVWDRYLRVPANPTLMDAYQLRPGDVVFNNTNSTELVGKSALFQGHSEPVVYSNHFTRLRVRPEALSPAYLAAWLNHEWQRGTFAEICNRWIGQSAVKADKLLALEIPLPPLAEQERIAGRLTEQLAAVERARAAAQSRLAAARSLPAAYLREVFEGPEASGWETRRLGELCEFRNGLNFNAGERGHSVKIIGVGDFREHLTAPIQTLGSVRLSKPPPDELLLRSGDIVFVRSNGSPDLVGRSMLVPPLDEPVTYGGFAIRARVRDEALAPNFLALYLKSGRFASLVKGLGRGANIRNISQEFLSELPVVAPESVEHQRRIAATLFARLAGAERVIDAARAELAAVDALPAALLREVFGGSDGSPCNAEAVK